MLTQYIQLIVYTCVLAFITNVVRFKGNELLNKWILITSSLGLVGIEGLLFHFEYTQWTLLIVIAVAVRCFQVPGGFISACIAWCISIILTGEGSIIWLFSYMLFASILFLVLYYIRNMQAESSAWLRKLSENSQQLNVFKEVSFSIQQTLNLHKLIHTILTSVTSGHGLGFDRAMILLIDDNETKLNGIMGTGPMTAEEGNGVGNLIENNAHVLLNEKVRKLEISLNERNFLYTVLESGMPFHVREIDGRDETLQKFAQQFNMSELAVFPLISQGIKVGVLIIDNLVNKRPITATDLDSIIPLANQAAIAIQHTHLYAKTEDMALKDGLTGLFNQRTFQTLLEKYWSDSENGPLSLILLDIDSFKCFNDTNGHLLGNKLLVQLADVIRHSIQEDDIAFRFGGEEFVVLLPHTNKDTAMIVAERIRSNVENTVFPGEDKQPMGRLTISIGVASSEEIHSSTSYHLVDRADQALYKAKAAGKNRVVS